MKLEKVIQQEICEFLRDCGLKVRIIKTTGTYDAKRKVFRKSNNEFAKNGKSDIEAFMPQLKKMLFIEVKSKTGTPTKDQIEYICNANDCGQIAFISRSVEQTYDQLEKFWPGIQDFKHLLKRYTIGH